jgi:hypothetical protein
LEKFLLLHRETICAGMKAEWLLNSEASNSIQQHLWVDTTVLATWIAATWRANSQFGFPKSLVIELCADWLCTFGAPPWLVVVEELQ